MTALAEHQPSNFATYSDITGNPVFDTFFVMADWGNGEELFAFSSPNDRLTAIAAFTRKGFTCSQVAHQDAFLLIRGGMRAWKHTGDVPAEAVWTPIKINFPACVA